LYFCRNFTAQNIIIEKLNLCRGFIDQFQNKIMASTDTPYYANQLRPSAFFSYRLTPVSGKITLTLTGLSGALVAVRFFCLTYIYNTKVMLLNAHKTYNRDNLLKRLNLGCGTGQNRNLLRRPLVMVVTFKLRLEVRTKAKAEQIAGSKFC
jgi:hypothetical protein